VTRWNSDLEEVRHTNIMMGDMQKALSIMLAPEDGIDRKLLSDKNNVAVDKMSLMFLTTETMILRQYECAAEPVLLLSKFFQESIPNAHLVLVHLRARIAEMREMRFMMYSDISHTHGEAITSRVKNEVVLSDEVTDRDDVGGRVEAMSRCIQNFRLIFADDLEVRCKLTSFVDENRVQNVARLPSDIAIAALLHPLLGGKPFVVLD
jgi:hypothetical protein